ncbi:MAG: type I secretion system permease/ATPase [Pseudomonadota bacterium]|nr:type I secretion system permease/ATPase [Pseudomonadota bacterium]
MPDVSSSPQPPFDTGVWGLSLIARFHGISVDPENLVHARGSTGVFTSLDLVRAARQKLQLKARAIQSSVGRLEKTPCPALTLRRDGSWIVLMAVKEGKVLFQEAGAKQPTVTELDAFKEYWTGEVILIAKRASLLDAARRFDLSWFWPEIVRHKRLFAEVLTVSFVLQILALISPLFFQVIVDKVLAHRGMTTLDVLMIALVTVSVFEVLLTALRTYTFSHTTSRIDVILGARLFSHLLRLPQAYFSSRRVGDSVARVRELETIRQFLTGSALTLTIDLAFVFVFLGVMASYSLALTAITLATVPLFVGLSVAITPMLQRRVEEKFARGAENQSFLVESVTGIETLKSLACEPQVQRRWEEQLAAYVCAGFRASQLSNIAGQLCQLISKLAMAATLYVGARLVMDGGLTVGGLVAFNMLSGRVTGPVLRLAQLWQDFCQARMAVDRLGDILNTPAEPAAGSGQSVLSHIKGHIRLDHVTFRYRPDGGPTLQDISLDIPAGQSLGIVGPSGSGKSTLTKLIQRLYIPEAGRVMVDGVDLALIDPAQLRRQVGVVLQENMLFHRTVQENIALADPGLPLERVIQAAKLAGAHEFICALPEGYNTLIGERGASLSGGQRQRIAIARALVTNPRILIFDEATSALDLESEHAIQANMRAICQGRTVIIIAHRLAAVRSCHRIITVEQGRIVEDGTHDQLLGKGGRYAALHRHQIGAVA